MAGFEEFDDKTAMDAVWREYVESFLSAAAVGFDVVPLLNGVALTDARDPFRDAPNELRRELAASREAAAETFHRQLGAKLASVDDPDLGPGEQRPARCLPDYIDAYRPAFLAAGEQQLAVLLEAVAWAPADEQLPAVTRFARVSGHHTTDVAARALLLRAAAELGSSRSGDARAFARALECVRELDHRPAAIEPTLVAAVDQSRAYLESRLSVPRVARRSHRAARVAVGSAPSAATIDLRADAAFAMFECAFALDVGDTDAAVSHATLGWKRMPTDVRRLAQQLHFDALLDRLGFTEHAEAIRATSAVPQLTHTAPARAGALAGSRFVGRHAVEHRIPELLPPPGLGH